jgi:hypothetical protein
VGSKPVLFGVFILAYRVSYNHTVIASIATEFFLAACRSKLHWVPFLLASILSLLPRHLQLPITLGPNLPMVPSEYVLRRDIADRALQTDVVVMLHVTLHQTPRILER